MMEYKNIYKKKESALLVFVQFKSFGNSKSRKPDKKYLSESIAELKNLTISAGAEVGATLEFNQTKPSPKYFISKGKLENAKNVICEKNADLTIFNNEITPAQQINLQEKLGIKIIDKTALILDIFAQRAHSREGKLQVELAQLNYILPRLTGKGVQLSRLGSGIGTRGPGEMKLEVDRRRIRKRISLLEKKINKVIIQRNVQRKKREENNIFKIALVGYTNSGKSTLLNAVTNSDVYTKNMLFSTLDSTTRKLNVAEGLEVLISDTVGFIEKLPHQLIASFKSTLEEVRRSNLLLLIADASSSSCEHHIASVKEVLKELNVYHKQIFLVFNKIDKVSKNKLLSVKMKYRDAIFISALEKTGMDDLYNKVKEIIEKDYLSITVKIPYSDNKLISYLYDNCQIIKKEYCKDGILLLLKADSRYYSKLTKYIYK